MLFGLENFYFFSSYFVELFRYFPMLWTMYSCTFCVVQNVFLFVENISLCWSEYYSVLFRIFSHVVFIMVLCLLEYFPGLVKIIFLCCSEYFSLLFRVKCFAKCNNFSRESLQEEYSWTCEKLKLAKWFKYYLKCYLQSIIGLHIIISKS